MTYEEFKKGYNIIIASYSYVIAHSETAQLLYEKFYKGLNARQFELACENACRNYRDEPPTTGQLLYEYNLLIPKFQKQEEQEEGVPMPEECKKKMDEIKLKKVEDV